MKNIAFLLFLFSFDSASAGYKECAAWDTFCKSPKQIIATKCRLGVPVKEDECKSLGIRQLHALWGNVEGLPVTNAGK